MDAFFPICTHKKKILKIKCIIKNSLKIKHSMCHTKINPMPKLSRCLIYRINFIKKEEAFPTPDFSTNIIFFFFILKKIVKMM